MSNKVTKVNMKGDRSLAIGLLSISSIVTITGLVVLSLILTGVIIIPGFIVPFPIKSACKKVSSYPIELVHCDIPRNIVVR